MVDKGEIMKRRNKGSAVVEMTLLIPIILGCVVMYINMILTLIDKSNLADETSTVRYEEDENISNDIKCFLEKMDKLSTNSSVYTGFKLVCSLPVPILLKIRTCLCTPISIVSKRICGIEL